MTRTHIKEILAKAGRFFNDPELHDLYTNIGFCFALLGPLAYFYNLGPVQMILFGEPEHVFRQYFSVFTSAIGIILLYLFPPTQKSKDKFEKWLAAHFPEDNPTQTKPHVLTVGSTSVAYEFKSTPENETQTLDYVNKKLTGILTGNPEADLHKFEGPLGIRIIAEDTKPISVPNKPDDGIYI
jgi:hypothetical protein